MDAPVNISEIAGFWRRVFAGLIDLLVLGLVGYLLGVVAEETLISLGRWGVLVGLLISVAYFGVLNSRLANGQTLGKKLLGTRVVGADNKPVSFVKAAVRFLVIGIPGFLGGELVLLTTDIPPLMLLVFLLVIAVGLGSVYLLIFNRVTRQTIYDLAVGTYVVKVTEDKEDKIPIGKVWRGHFGIIAVIAVLLTGAIDAFTALLGAPSISKLAEMRTMLIDMPEVSDAGVNFSSNTKIKKSGNETSKLILATLILKTNQISDASLAEKVRLLVERQLARKSGADVIVVILSYGYNIGIAKRYQSYRYSFKVANKRVRATANVLPS